MPVSTVLIFLFYSSDRWHAAPANIAVLLYIGADDPLLPSSLG